MQQPTKIFDPFVRVIYTIVCKEFSEETQQSRNRAPTRARHDNRVILIDRLEIREDALVDFERLKTEGLHDIGQERRQSSTCKAKQQLCIQRSEEVCKISIGVNEACVRRIAEQEADSRVRRKTRHVAHDGLRGSRLEWGRGSLCEVAIYCAR